MADNGVTITIVKLDEKKPYAMGVAKVEATEEDYCEECGNAVLVEAIGVRWVVTRNDEIIFSDYRFTDKGLSATKQYFDACRG